MSRSKAFFIVFAMIVLPMGFIDREERAEDMRGAIHGNVKDIRGPLAGATIRFKGKPGYALTDSFGEFILPPCVGAERISASKEGYFIAGRATASKPISIILRRLPDEDCERYTWVDPIPDPARPLNCGNCHRAVYNELQHTGHGHSGMNRRFLNLYEGTDWRGKPGIGWNLLKDHPEGAGVCSSCHAPTQKPAPFADFDMRGAAKESSGLSGVHCDFCHKIAGPGDGEFGLTHGKHQLRLLRPEPELAKDHQLFFGPLDDVDRGDDSYSSFQRDSRLCAACHEGVVFGVPVYTTYSEWLASPAGKAGKSCQACHMAPTGKMSNVAPGKGGIARDPATLANHTFFAGSQLEMLRRCLKMNASTRRTADAVEIDISLTAESVGHQLPTGFVDRQVILFVEAYANGQPVPLLRGPTLPEFMGESEGRKPGRLYAKLLVDENGMTPVPFWKAVPATVRDTRLRPGLTDRMEFRFPARTDRIHVRLVHRRFWKQTAEEKQWPTNEQVIEDRDILPKP